MEKISSVHSVTKIKWAYMLMGIVLVMVVVFGVTYAAFSDKGEVQGAKITVGSADIKLIQDLALGAVVENLFDELTGPVYSNIGQTWTEDYLVKLFNNAPGALTLSTSAYYETANDLSDLREDIYVEIIDWDDADGDGYVSEGELGTSYGSKTIIKWKTEGFSLGNFDSGAVRGFVVRFNAPTISETKQGASFLFDFMFNAASLE